MTVDIKINRTVKLLGKAHIYTAQELIQRPSNKTRHKKGASSVWPKDTEEKWQKEATEGAIYLPAFKRFLVHSFHGDFPQATSGGGGGRGFLCD